MTATGTVHPASHEPRLALVDVVKEYRTEIGPRRVLDGISFALAKGRKIGVLGRNGSGKSTLVRIIGGADKPTSGRILRNMTISWPLGFNGGFATTMTGFDNVRFLARIYGRPLDETAAYVADFAELGRLIHTPVHTYSSGMRARLAFALTLAIDFDCFLIDEVIAVGDQKFREKCRQELFGRRKHSAMILVTHDLSLLTTYCDQALVMKAGRGKVFDDVAEAIEIYRSL